MSLRSADGRTVVMDPYRPGALGGRIAFDPVRVAADVVTVSHHHVDHAHVSPDLASAGGEMPPVLDRSGVGAGIAFEHRFTYHDRFGGSRMGLTAMVGFELDGLRVAHLGDIGCPLTPDDVRALGPIDVLIWPVGGVYTLGPDDAAAVLDALAPRIALPVHYEHARCRLGMAGLDALEPHLTDTRVDTTWTRSGASTWSSAQGLPAVPTVLALEPANG